MNFKKKAVHIHDNVAVFIHILLQTNSFLATIHIDQNAGFDHDILSTFNNLINSKFFFFKFFYYFFVAHKYVCINYYCNFKPLLFFISVLKGETKWLK